MAGEPLDHLRSMAHARKFKPSSSGEEKIGRGAPGVSNIHYCVINHPKTQYLKIITHFRTTHSFRKTQLGDLVAGPAGGSAGVLSRGLSLHHVLSLGELTWASSQHGATSGRMPCTFAARSQEPALLLDAMGVAVLKEGQASWGGNSPCCSVGWMPKTM